MQATGDSRLERASGAADEAAPSKPHGASEPPAQMFHAQSGVSAARAAGATVLLDMRSGLYHTLNEAAGRIWDIIEAGDATLATLVDVLTAEYPDVPRKTIVGDTTRLLDTLLEAGVVTIAAQPRAAGHASAERGVP